MHKTVAEKVVSFTAELLEKAPETGSAHFTLSAVEAHDPSLRMFLCWTADRPGDLQPTANRLHLPKRYLVNEDVRDVVDFLFLVLNVLLHYLSLYLNHEKL